MIFYSTSAQINGYLVQLNFIGETKMSTKDTLENMARNTWLAGLGSIDSSKEALGKSIDAAQEKSNSLYSELLTRGEKIQSKINDKKDELQAKSKNFLGMGSEKSHEVKLAQLNTTVDRLTTAVVALIEKRNAAAPKAPATAAPKATTEKAAPKATTANAAPKASTTKAAPKATTAKAAPKATTAKAAPKATTTKAEPTATAAKAEAKATTAKAEAKATTAKAEPNVTAVVTNKAK
ncbi:MAG: hypothetical protein ACJAWT_001629 [Glaciecola sp.]